MRRIVRREDGGGAAGGGAGPRSTIAGSPPPADGPRACLSPPNDTSGRRAWGPPVSPGSDAFPETRVSRGHSRPRPAPPRSTCPASRPRVLASSDSLDDFFAEQALGTE